MIVPWFPQWCVAFASETILFSLFGTFCRAECELCALNFVSCWVYPKRAGTGWSEHFFKPLCRVHTRCVNHVQLVPNEDSRFSGECRIDQTNKINKNKSHQRGREWERKKNRWKMATWNQLKYLPTDLAAHKTQAWIPIEWMNWVTIKNERRERELEKCGGMEKSFK